MFKLNQARYIGLVKPMNGQSWRQFLKLDNLDLCAFLSGGLTLDFLKSVKELYFHLFPTLPSKCPIEPGKYSFKNVSIFEGGQSGSEAKKKIGPRGPGGFLSPANLPNGIYRHTVRFYNNFDPEGFMFYWHVEFYNSMGEDRF